LHCSDGQAERFLAIRIIFPISQLHKQPLLFIELHYADVFLCLNIDFYQGHSDKEQREHSDHDDSASHEDGNFFAHDTTTWQKWG
jgi:hypothetical protein